MTRFITFFKVSEFVGKLQYKKEKCIEVVLNIKLKLETFVSKNITILHLKIIFFTAVKTCSILHGHVFVMNQTESVIFFSFLYSLLPGDLTIQK